MSGKVFFSFMFISIFTLLSLFLYMEKSRNYIRDLEIISVTDKSGIETALVRFPDGKKGYLCKRINKKEAGRWFYQESGKPVHWDFVEGKVVSWKSINSK